MKIFRKELLSLFLVLLPCMALFAQSSAKTYTKADTLRGSITPERA